MSSTFSSDWPAEGSGGGGSGITALTGDVSASGSGSVAATVNTVGGQSAASVATAATSVAAATNLNTPSTIIERDANGNFQANNIETAVTSTVSAGTTTALTVASTKTQLLTGTANQTYTLPDATTLVLGFTFDFINTNPSTGVMTIKDHGGTILFVGPPLTEALATCTSIGSSAGTWVISPQLNNGACSSEAGLTIDSGQYYGFGANYQLGVGNYSLGGDGASYTLLNVASGGTIYHRVANSGVMSMTSAGLTMGGSNYLATQTLNLAGSTSGTLTHKANATTTNHTLYWPAMQGGSSTVLTNDGSGNLTWAAGGGYSPPTTQLQVTSPTGLGAVGISTRTWGAVSINNGGADISYNSDAVNGDNITINTSGLYFLSLQDANAAGTALGGITLNASGTDLASDITSLGSKIIIVSTLANYGDGACGQALTAMVYLSAASVLHCQYNNGGSYAYPDTGSPANFNAAFTVTRIS